MVLTIQFKTKTNCYNEHKSHFVSSVCPRCVSISFRDIVNSLNAHFHRQRIYGNKMTSLSAVRADACSILAFSV